jgi:hypothetical protein
VLIKETIIWHRIMWGRLHLVNLKGLGSGIQESLSTAMYLGINGEGAQLTR